MITDDRFWKVLWNTVYFTVGNVPVGLALALGLAIAMNQKIRGIVFFRMTYFLPVVSSMVAVSLLWSWIYAKDIGILNWLLGKVGIPRIPWLSSTRWAMPSVIVMSIWKSLGYDMVVFLAGLQSIPPELYEAGKIDGAASWRLFRHITIPMLSPITFFLLMLSVINSFQVFAQTYVMTQGGPLWSTLTLVYYIFQWAFQRFSMGYASALAWVLFLIILALTLIQFRFEREWVHYE
jgi:multiple sugar transport system permease protein